MRLWYPATNIGGEPLVVVEAAIPSTGAWEAAARDGARAVFKLVAGHDYRPGHNYLPDANGAGRLVVLQFSYEDFTEELRGAAVAAFADEWRKLVPDQQLGGGSEQVRR